MTFRDCAHTTIAAPDESRSCRTRSQAKLVSRCRCFARFLAARLRSLDDFALASKKKPLRIANFESNKKAECKPNQIATQLYLHGTA